LTLLATVGEQAEWNVRDQSIGHQAIPLPSEEIVARAPMISQLIRQLGLEIYTIIRPEPSILIDATRQGNQGMEHRNDPPYRYQGIEAVTESLCADPVVRKFLGNEGAAQQALAAVEPLGK